MEVDTLSLKNKELELLKYKARMKECLPHLYGFSLYDWQSEFITCPKEYQFLTSANQVGKTTTLMLKIVRLATDIELQKKLWKDKPTLFWYCLPTIEMHTTFFKTKWLPNILPRHEFQDHPLYGWRTERIGPSIKSIIFNSGVIVAFVPYGRSLEALQGATCHAVFFDEEPNAEIVPEIQTRTSSIKIAEGNMANALGGMKVFAFTATKSQEYFRRIMEERGKKELFPMSHGNVWKKTISLYECQKFADGSPSHWTDEKIAGVVSNLSSEAEVQRRVMGRFVLDEGLKYHSFSHSKNVKPKKELSGNWLIYAGLDYGSGGTAHKSAIVFIAINNSYTKGRVRLVWRGEDGVDTTAGDLVNEYESLISENKFNVITGYYDWGAKDILTFAQRKEIPLSKANKDHAIGESVLNDLFKYEMLDIEVSEEDEDDRANFLINELASLRKDTNKRIANDDCIDALRYAVSSIPWDFNTVKKKLKIEEQSEAGIPQEVENEHDRRKKRNTSEINYGIEDEINEWNSYFE